MLLMQPSARQSEIFVWPKSRSLVQMAFRSRLLSLHLAARSPDSRQSACRRSRLIS